MDCLIVRFAILGEEKKAKESLKSLGINIPDGKWGVDIQLTEDQALEFSDKIYKLGWDSLYIDRCDKSKVGYDTIIQISSPSWILYCEDEVKSGRMTLDEFTKLLDVEV